MQPTFSESHAPPWWLRLILWVLVPVALFGYGYHVKGTDGLFRALAAFGALLVPFIAFEVGQWMYGGIRVQDGVVYVGRRRSAPVSALDFDTLSFDETPDIFDVFGASNLKSNPIWLRHTVALRGRRADLEPVEVIVRTNRPDEFVAALRAAAG